MFNYGNSIDRNFYTYLNKDPEPSAWNKFPTVENPLNRYKFTSIEVNHSANMQTIGRQTYSLLDWLGDMGGYGAGKSRESPRAIAGAATERAWKLSVVGCC